MNPAPPELSCSGKPVASRTCLLKARKAFCPTLWSDAFLLLILMSSPGLAAAQTAQLTEQLGRTVLYDDIAVSPDGKWVAWVQSTAATAPKTTYISSTAAGAQPKKVDTGYAGERFDADPAWSPDSRTLAFFSAPGETNQT